MKIETFIAWAQSVGCKINSSEGRTYGLKQWILPNGDTLTFPERDENGEWLHHGMIINLLGIGYTEPCGYGEEELEYWSVVTALCAHFGIARECGGDFQVWNSRSYKGIESYLLKKNKDGSKFGLEVGMPSVHAIVGPIADHGFSVSKALAAVGNKSSAYYSPNPSEYIEDFFNSVCVEDIDAEV